MKYEFTEDESLLRKYLALPEVAREFVRLTVHPTKLKSVVEDLYFDLKNSHENDLN